MFPERMLACVDGPATLATTQLELAWLARRIVRAADVSALVLPPADVTRLSAAAMTT